MKAVDILIDNGNGTEIHPKSGLYNDCALLARMPDFLRIENLRGIDIRNA